MPDIAHEVGSGLTTDFVATQRGRAGATPTPMPAIPVWLRLAVILGIAVMLWAAIVSGLHWGLYWLLMR